MLKSHRQLLLARKAHIENLISLIDKRIGVDNMDYREGIAEEQLKSEFADEVRRRWEILRSTESTRRKSKTINPKITLREQMRFLRHLQKPQAVRRADREVQELVRRWPGIHYGKLL